MKLSHLIVMPLLVQVSTQQNSLNCGWSGLSCRDGEQCFDKRYFCSGWRECNDRTDETYRSYAVGYPAGTSFCRGRHGHICVFPAYLGKMDGMCQKVTSNYRCKDNEFACADGSRCISSTAFCNGFQDCPDNSDERLRNIHTDILEITVGCRGRFDNICVHRTSFKTKLGDSCTDGVGCHDGEFPCADGSQCIKSFYFCDGRQQCRDGSDEPRLRNSSIDIAADTTFCRGDNGRICVLPDDFVPYKNAFCKELSGWRCGFGEFTCADGSQCIKAIQFCDGRKDCRDGSDEPPVRLDTVNYPSNTTFCPGSWDSHCVLPDELVPYKEDFCGYDLRTRGRPLPITILTQKRMTTTTRWLITRRLANTCYPAICVVDIILIVCFLFWLVAVRPFIYLFWNPLSLSLSDLICVAKRSFCIVSKSSTSVSDRVLVFVFCL